MKCASAFAVRAYSRPQTVCDAQHTYQRAYQRNTHGIGNDEDAADRSHDGSPQNLQARLPMKMTSRRVPLILRQIQRIQAVITQAQPTMVMMERYISTCQPT